MLEFWKLLMEQPLTPKRLMLPGLGVMAAARELGGKEFVFPSPDSVSEREMPYTENALMLFVRANRKNFADKHCAFSVHGFRSTLETWASENGYRKDLMSALTGYFNKTEYNRSEFLKDKYEILKRYSHYLVYSHTPQCKQCTYKQLASTLKSKLFTGSTRIFRHCWWRFGRFQTVASR
jgi:hypothetical protein